VSGCCNEHGCRRKKPIKLGRSPLTGTWYREKGADPP
jgi:hypothetical protein